MRQMAAGVRVMHATDRIAARWCALFESYRLPRDGTVIEVGPGFAPKVGRALQAYGFRGCLFVVEPHSEACESIVAQYRRLLPACIIVPVQLTVDRAATVLPPDVDALVMNHMLDDFVLHASLCEIARASLFGKMQPGRPCSHDARNAWQRVAHDRIAFARIAEQVLADVCSFCTSVMPPWVAMSQYVSWIHAHEGLEFVDTLTAPLLRRLAGRLAATGAYPDISLVHDDRWLIARAMSMHAAPPCLHQVATA